MGLILSLASSARAQSLDAHERALVGHWGTIQPRVVGPSGFALLLSPDGTFVELRERHVSCLAVEGANCDPRPHAVRGVFHADGRTLSLGPERFDYTLRGGRLTLTQQTVLRPRPRTTLRRIRALAGTSSLWPAPTGASDAALVRALVGRWSIPSGAQRTVFFEILELRADGTFDAEWAWERFDVALHGRWEAHAGMLFFTLSDGSVLPPMRAERTADALRLSDPSSRLVSELRSSPDFACSATLHCDAASSYCLRVLTDVAGNGDDYFCEPLPRECRSCDCAARGGDRCVGTPLEGIRITRPGG